MISHVATITNNESRFCNHTLDFSFIKDGEGYIVRVPGNLLGRISRAGNRGWNYGQDLGLLHCYVTGTRKNAAEMLAVKAGLLDGNFNSIDTVQS